MGDEAIQLITTFRVWIWSKLVKLLQLLAATALVGSFSFPTALKLAARMVTTAPPARPTTYTTLTSR